MLVTVSNTRGISEETLAETWTLRRLLHAFVMHMHDRYGWMQLAMDMFSGISTGASNDIKQKSKTNSRKLPSWYKHKAKSGNYSIAHVEDPLPMMRMAGLPVAEGPGDEETKIKRATAAASLLHKARRA
jgi:hypothetical protein